MIWFFIIFICVLVIVRILIGTYPKAASNDGAIVMVAGILINGAVQQFPTLASSVGKSCYRLISCGNITRPFTLDRKTF